MKYITNTSKHTVLATVSTRFARAAGIAMLVISSAITSTQAFSQQEPLPLVGNRVATFIDVEGQPSRAIDAVKAGFKAQAVSIEATTQAWSGSGLRNGKYIGYIDHYSFDEPKNNYVYSAPYAQLQLHIASKSAKAVDITRLDKIYRQRLGIENRFANTDRLRGERSISWARSPDFLSNIGQLAGQRVEYIIADKYMLDEFNQLLAVNNDEPLYLSSKAIYTVDIRLAINAANPQAKAIIKAFDSGIAELRQSGALQAILYPRSNGVSTLDESLYTDIIRRW